MSWKEVVHGPYIVLEMGQFAEEVVNGPYIVLEMGQFAATKEGVIETC